MLDYNKELGKAVQHFWRTRGRQKKRQGGDTGLKDAGNRAAVTGGKHADGFVRLMAAIVKDAALPSVEINVAEKKPRTLPGFYRPCKVSLAKLNRVLCELGLPAAKRADIAPLLAA